MRPLFLWAFFNLIIDDTELRGVDTNTLIAKHEQL